MKKILTPIMPLAVFATLAGCSSVGNAEKEVPYRLLMQNMMQEDIRATAIFDDEPIWEDMYLGGTRDSKRPPEWGGGGKTSLDYRSWPKRIKVRWYPLAEEEICVRKWERDWCSQPEIIERGREQEMAAPPYPLLEDGSPSRAPHLNIYYFEDRVIALSEPGFEWPIGSGSFAKRGWAEYHAARAADLPPAKFIPPPPEKSETDLEKEQMEKPAEAPASASPVNGVKEPSEEPLPVPTCNDIDGCVRLAILENSVFVEACGIVVPEVKKEMEKAFADWTVLKLPIPGLQEALKPDNPQRAQLLARILPYLEKIPLHEVSIECAGRHAMMKAIEPTLRSDAAYLPEGVLKRYRR